MVKIIDCYTKYNNDYSVEILYSFIDENGRHNFNKVNADNIKYSFFLIPNTKNRFRYIYTVKDLILTGGIIYKIEAPYKVYTQIKSIKNKILSGEIQSADKILNNYLLKSFETAKKKGLLSITKYFLDKSQNKLTSINLDYNSFIKEFNPYNYYIANDFNLEVKFPYIANFNIADYEDITLGFLDIEVITDGKFPNEEEAKYPITSIALVIYRPSKKKYKVVNYIYIDKKFTKASIDAVKHYLDKIRNNFLNLEEFSEIFNALPELNTNFDGFYYKIFVDEKTMLEDFAQLLKSENVNLLSGWNSISFDMKYMFFRGLNLNARNFINYIYRDEEFIKNEIAKTKEKNIFVKISSASEYYIPGIPHIDMKEILESSFLKQQFKSYKLDYIAKEILKTGKIYIPDLNKAYKDPNQIELFIKYNILDSILVFAIELKQVLIKTLFTIRNTTGFFTFFNLNINNVLDSYLNTFAIKNKVFFVSKHEATHLNHELFKIYLEVNNYKKSHLELLRLVK